MHACMSSMSAMHGQYDIMMSYTDYRYELEPKICTLDYNTMLYMGYSAAILKYLTIYNFIKYQVPVSPLELSCNWDYRLP